MNVGVAIVTYGDQSHFNGIRQSIAAIEEVQQVKKIVIIQNGEEYNLENELSRIKYNKNIELIINKKNNGSAGGFSQALMTLSRDDKVDHILLLDDDTRMNVDAITNIEDFESRYKLTDNHIWSLFREKRYGRENFERDWDYNLNYFKNRFISFSIAQYLNKKRMQSTRRYKELSNLLYAPYAGMLINKQVIKKVSLPNPNYFLYVDDIDYSLKLKKNGYKIYQIETAGLEDLSTSWSADNKHSAASFFQKNVNPGRYLYNVRNWVYLIHSNDMITNKFIFLINEFVYKIVIFLIFMPKNKWGLSRYRQILKAVKNGKNGKLGFESDFQL